MKIELLSRETIKPSLPTPSHLKIYPLSFIDNIYSRLYLPAVFFYNGNDNSDQNFKISQLRKSLSHLLSTYYPFAGRFKDKITIECNDLGVPFLVTKIKNKLSNVLQNPSDIFMNSLFPVQLQGKVQDWSEPIMSFQINCFACGGMAISVCISHKCCDATTFFNFMNDWAIMNRKLVEEKEGLLISPVSLLDGGASVFPQGNLPIFPEVLTSTENNVVCKRFVFQPSMIKFLRKMVTSSPMNYPSRVIVVKAWIYKTLVSIMGLNFKTTPCHMAVGLRKRMVPPLSEKCVGNIFWVLSMFPDKKEMELRDLVFKLVEGFSEFNDVYPKLFGGNGKDNLSLISQCLRKATVPPSEKEISVVFSSWCRMPMYEINFGWGNPTWVTTTGWGKSIFLLDTKDGNGIEIVIKMKENILEKFEHEVEILQYASLNPCNV